MAKATLSTPWGAISYKSTETEEQVSQSFDYVDFTGVFEATIDRVYGTEFVNKTTGAVTTNVIFRLIKDGDKLITCKELMTYTSKEEDLSKGIKKGDVIPSKGHNLVAALVGMTSGKATATAAWTKTVIKEYGKDINVREIKSLAGKKVSVRTQIERKIYTNKDGEEKAIQETTLDRVFSVDGYSLTEYNEAMEVIKNDPNMLLSKAVEAKAIITAGKRPGKPRYRKCEEEEWLELKELTDGGDSSDELGDTSTNDLDSLDDDLPSLEDISNEELPTLDDNTDETPTVSDDSQTTKDTPQEVPDLDDISL